MGVTVRRGRIFTRRLVRYVAIVIAPGVPLDDLAEAQLRELVESRARERQRVEFKRELPGRSDDAKREFLQDASSFANAGGGDLIFGIREEEGAAAELTPLTCDPDAEILRMEGTLKSVLEPRLLGVHTQPVAVEGGWVIVMRIPASWTGPHAIRSKNEGSYRFYSRNSAGKYPLDVSGIRAAFLSADSATRRISDWHAARLGKIVANETPVQLRSAPRIALHVAPLAAQAVEPGAVIGTGILKPLALDTDQERWNIDGMLASARGDSRGAMGFAQLFRDGHFETVNAILLEWLRLRDEPSGLINGIGLESQVLQGVANPLRALQIAGAQPPFAILVSLIDVKGMDLTNPQGFHGASTPIDRDLLVLPEVLCDAFDWNREAGMRPIIDALWQSSGGQGSPSYDANGAWTGE